MSLSWSCPSCPDAGRFLTIDRIDIRISNFNEIMRRTMPIKESKDFRLYSKPSIYVVSKDVPPQSGDANNGSWRSCILSRLELRLQRNQALVETYLDGRLTTKCVTWAYTVDKWFKNLHWDQHYIHLDSNQDASSFERREKQLRTNCSTSTVKLQMAHHDGAGTLPLNLYTWEIVYRFKSTRTYSNLSKRIYEATIHPYHKTIIIGYRFRLLYILKILKDGNGSQNSYLMRYYWYHSLVPYKKRTTASSPYRYHLHIRSVAAGSNL